MDRVSGLGCGNTFHLGKQRRALHSKPGDRSWVEPYSPWNHWILIPFESCRNESCQLCLSRKVGSHVYRCDSKLLMHPNSAPAAARTHFWSWKERCVEWRVVWQLPISKASVLLKSQLWHIKRDRWTDGWIDSNHVTAKFGKLAAPHHTLKMRGIIYIIIIDCSMEI